MEADFIVRGSFWTPVKILELRAFASFRFMFVGCVNKSHNLNPYKSQTYKEIQRSDWQILVI